MTINEKLLNNYGVVEINPLSNPDYHYEEREYIDWSELKNKKGICAERIRFVTDNGFPFFDLSYCHIIINNKKYMVTNTPFEQISKNNFKSNLYKILKKDNVYIKGFFENISYLC